MPLTAAELEEKLETYSIQLQAGRPGRPLVAVCDKCESYIDGIIENLDSLDGKTRSFLVGKSEQELRKYLARKTKEVLVFDPTEKDALHGAFCDILGYHPAEVRGIDMVGVCNCIYSIEKLSTSGGKSLHPSTVSLLGHELIHALQADAYGGAVPFILAYRSYNSYNNPFEWAAYSFGGTAPTPILASATGLPASPVFG